MQYLPYIITILCTVVPLLVAHIISHAKTSARCEVNEKRIENHEKICMEDKRELRREIREDNTRIYDEIKSISERIRA